MEIRCDVFSQQKVTLKGRETLKFVDLKSRLVMGKSPIFLPPSPPQNLGIFGDFPSKKPQNLEFPHPQSVPEHSKSCNPVPIPEIWGFSGINPNKSPNFGLSPSPKYPRSVFKPCPCPYSFPKKNGTGMGINGD